MGRSLYQDLMTLLFRIAALAAIALVVGLTLGPIEIRQLSPVAPAWDRALAYLAISALLILAFPRRPLLVGLAVLALIIGLELAQQMTPDRHANLSDVLQKLGGAATGLLIGVGLDRLLRVRR